MTDAARDDQQVRLQLSIFPIPNRLQVSLRGSWGRWARGLLACVAGAVLLGGAALGGLIATVTLSTAADAQQRVIASEGRASRITLVVNKSESYRLDAPFADVLVGSSDIADVIPLSDRQIYVLGKKIGTTNVTLYDRNKRLLNVIDVDVRMDTTNVESKIRSSSGSRNIRVGSVDGKLVLSGTADDAQAVDRAMNVAAGLAPAGVVNALNVNSSQQVMLKVRFVEASRDAARALGIRWDFLAPGKAAGSIGSIAASTKNTFAGAAIADAISSASGAPPFASVIGRLISNNNGTLDVALSALEEQGYVRRLAEPNLVAISGQSADFLAGGEFPVPVSASTTNGFPTTTIEFKEFGVGLSFTPTVLADKVINLRLEPTVSELDYTNAVRLQGVEIPGLVKRRAKTTIELRDGQSFAIAGLIQAQSARALEQVPWLGTVPVLGALFRSPSFQQKETELVVIVTPYLVRPVAPGRQLKTPLDTTLPGNDLDYFLNGRAEIKKTNNGLTTANGVDAGAAGGIAAGAPAPNETRLLK
ncbi:MAG: type II and III secretion system protein family protein [Alsobacter sp.]